MRFCSLVLLPNGLFAVHESPSVKKRLTIERSFGLTDFGFPLVIVRNVPVENTEVFELLMRHTRPGIVRQSLVTTRSMVIGRNRERGSILTRLV